MNHMTNAKNERRSHLIYKDNRGILTFDEIRELKGLQDQSREHLRRVAPVPCLDDKVVKRIGELERQL